MGNNFRSHLQSLRDNYSFLLHTECSKDETEQLKELKGNNKSLPEDIICHEAAQWDESEPTFTRVSNDSNITYEERVEYLLLLQTEHLQSIKRYALFFVVLACISIALTVISVISFLS